MDPIELRVSEALAKAAIAEKIAEKALSLAQDLYAELKYLKLQSTPIAPMPLDPFVPEDSAPAPTQKVVKVSPFSVSQGFRPQTAKKASENFEKGLTEAEEVTQELWNDAIA